MIKILADIDVNTVLSGYNKLASAIKWTDYGFHGKQTGLQYRENKDPWSDAVGRRGPDAWPDVNFLNPAFKDTIFEEIIIQYNLIRTRLMWVPPYACYSMHKDDSPRIHVPLITNPDCYFVFKDLAPVHLTIGQVHWVDTTKAHTFMNCSNLPRLHLVGQTKFTEIS